MLPVGSRVRGPNKRSAMVDLRIKSETPCVPRDPLADGGEEVLFM